MMKDFVCFASYNDGKVHSDILEKYPGTEKSVVIPDCFTMIEFEAFQNNRTIESVEIPESVQLIKGEAFEGCSNLKSVKLPGNLYGICPQAFGDSKTTAEFLLENPNYVEQDGFIINKSNNTLLLRLLA